ncbi:MAG: PD-(D/E)XK nuclease family protein [Deltaproteobacteria bacterium]|nr:PD-(D/E)XK nuclease family protein [Deltaproteobacteria bacterium]
MTGAIAFTPLVGLRLGGAALTPFDDHAPGSGAVGKPVWGPAALLGDLELRLGLAHEEAASCVREQSFASRLEALASSERFWTASYQADRIGTGAALLAWRDTLVEAGWDSGPVPGGGPRLDALAEIEAAAGPPLPIGRVDRVERMERALAARPRAFYDSVTLAEEASLWPARWRRVFDLLESAGTAVSVLAPRFDSAPEGTDLGDLQRLVRGETATPRRVIGDGTLVMMRAPTSWELGETVSCLLRVEAGDLGSTVIVRGGEHGALEAGLAAQGLASQGLASSSRGRPVGQVLPLALELAFEPRDPYRVLELLTLPVGPFQGAVGRSLARALVEAPGIGGPAWRAAKERIRGNAGDDPARIERRLARVEEWLESAGIPRHEAAPRHRLIEIAARVEEWLRTRLALGEDADPVLAAAYRQASAFGRVLAQDARPALTLVEARVLADRVTEGGFAVALAQERAGRLDHVDDPGALVVPRDTVVFWHAVAGTERCPTFGSWRETERAALERAGVSLAAPDDVLADENAAWRRALLAARRRLVLAVPETAMGEPCSPHPLWDEIVGRLALDDAATARLTVTARQLRAGRLPVAPAPGADLPTARAEWRLPVSIGDPRAHAHSASSLEALLRCPLRWVLGYPAGLRSGAVAALPDHQRLAGNLGHRLVQRLHETGALHLDTAAMTGAAGSLLDSLLPEEGAPWLLPGRAFEREQSSQLLVRAALRLATVLAASGLTVEDVEVKLERAWGERTLHGRADLLARDRSGRRVVVDLKWGASSYEKLVSKGLALQLAVYAIAASTSGRAVPAGYFSLKASRFLTTEQGLFDGAQPLAGRSVSETLDAAERTLCLVEQALRESRIHATGLADSPGLLGALGVVDADAPRHLDFRHDEEGPCKYCTHGAICGKSWEGLR